MFEYSGLARVRRGLEDSATMLWSVLVGHVRKSSECGGNHSVNSGGLMTRLLSTHDSSLSFSSELLRGYASSVSGVGLVVGLSLLGLFAARGRGVFCP